MIEDLDFVYLKNMPIYQQLQIEEALLRADDKNYLIVSHGTCRSIVMGLSGEKEKLIDIKKAEKDLIPIIKRFSGGGTVIVDENTLFVSWILSKNAINVSPFPESIMRWSESIYQKAWNINGFHLKENDYCLMDKKCGGNAQYITKDRLLHHTSFLWDFEEKNMDYLLMPEKRPSYRKDRNHLDFITKLKPFGSIDQLIFKLKKTVFVTEERQINIEEIISRPHRKATVLF